MVIILHLNLFFRFIKKEKQHIYNFTESDIMQGLGITNVLTTYFYQPFI